MTPVARHPFVPVAPVRIAGACSAAALALALIVGPSHAQTFTRITDATNPVVTDAFGSGGASWIDLNGDGLLDLFVANGNLASQDDNLYLNLGGGNFYKVTTGPVVTSGGSSIGGAFGDYDNDGLPDLFVTNRNNFGNFLFRGLGDSSFVRIFAGQPPNDIANSNSSSWVDLDGDGDLDLYVVNFAGNDFLYVNGGAPTYTLTRLDTLPMTAGGEFSICGAWADFNDDRRPDLFVANAGNQSDALFVNNGGLFFTRRNLGDAISSLGASWGDFDNDGDLDLFVAGYLSQSSVLYRNDGPPGYTLTPVSASVFPASPGNAVGSAWGDFDNDGDLDLVVGDDGGNNRLYVNSGAPSYTFTRVLTGAEVSEGGNTFGCSWADMDGDGDLDLFFANQQNQANFLYRNDGAVGSWLGVRCVGTVSNRSAIGAKVRVSAVIGGQHIRQTQEVLAQSGYNSQNLELHFGLGDATRVDTLRIEWPSGLTETFTDLPAQRWLTVREGVGPLAVEASGVRADVELAVRSANPFRAAAELEYAMAREGRVSLRVFDVTGATVSTLVDEWRPAGRHHVRFAPGASVPSGVYFCRLQVGDVERTVRLLRVR
jgi:ASPIC and UnbV/FG-GAP-like repeat